MSMEGIVRGLGVSFLVTVLFTPVIRYIALKVGWAHRPDPRKWRRKVNPHTFQIAMGGGFAMFVGFAVATTLSLNPRLLPITFFAFCASMVGFYDDMKNPRPVYRLAIQTLFGLITVSLIGWVYGLPIWLGILISIFGVVGLMNSVNMMDNMDGVASGLITLSMLGYAILGWLTKNEFATVLSLIVAGAAFGFWIYNKPPATIFMGDTGSIMLGYLLAVTGIVASWGEYANLFARLVAPLLFASVFITDTTFVVLWRKTHGLSVMQGDRNHISHRLAVMFGHSEWMANLVLYSIQLLMNASAIVVVLSPIPVAVTILLFAFSLIGILCWRLWQVQME